MHPQPFERVGCDVPLPLSPSTCSFSSCSAVSPPLLQQPSLSSSSSSSSYSSSSFSRLRRRTRTRRRACVTLAALELLLYSSLSLFLFLSLSLSSCTAFLVSRTSIATKITTRKTTAEAGDRTKTGMCWNYETLLFGRRGRRRSGVGVSVSVGVGVGVGAGNSFGEDYGASSRPNVRRRRRCPRCPHRHWLICSGERRSLSGNERRGCGFGSLVLRAIVGGEENEEEVRDERRRRRRQRTRRQRQRRQKLQQNHHHHHHHHPNEDEDEDESADSSVLVGILERNVVGPDADSDIDADLSPTFEASFVARSSQSFSPSLEELLCRPHGDVTAPLSDRDLISRAYAFAEAAEAAVKRERVEEVTSVASTQHGRSRGRGSKSGNGQHRFRRALGTAKIVSSMNLDAASVASALLLPFLAQSDDTYHHHHHSTLEKDAKVKPITEMTTATATTTTMGRLIMEIFEPEVADLVHGSAEIGKMVYNGAPLTVSSSSSSSSALARTRAVQAENFRRMILATSKDVRSVLVKLAERTYEVRSILAKRDFCLSGTEGWKECNLDNDEKNNYDDDDHEDNDEEENPRRESIARETLDLWAPLADRLGIFKLKTELEDASLKLLRPEVYRELKSMVTAKQERRQAYTLDVISTIESALTAAGMHGASVSGRAKHLYSVFTKMQSKNKAFDQIEDLVAFRILTDDDVAQCYQALGTIHGMWEPVPGRFKDYIASPKPNGYRSLHTTVVGPLGRKIEVQIRTKEMHRIAEEGIAAHWMYKDKTNGGGSDGGRARDDGDNATESRRIALLRQLVDWVRRTDSEDDDGYGDDRNDGDQDNEATTTTKKKKKEKMNGATAARPIQSHKLFDDEVFVFSPSGQLFALKKGSTTLDFAYRIHTDLGNGCVGARADGRIVPLRYELRNGDTVEVMHSSQQSPRRDWLNIVQTSRARSKIKAWLKAQRREANVYAGRDMFDKEVRRRRPAGGGDSAGAVQAGPVVGSSSRSYKRNLGRVLASFKIEDEERLMAAIGQGHVSASAAADVFWGRKGWDKEGDHLPGNTVDAYAFGNAYIVDRMAPRRSTATKKKEISPSARTKDDGIVVGGERNVLVGFCRNCNPLRGESIGGVVTMGRGITIHRTGCRYLTQCDAERRIAATWNPEAEEEAVAAAKGTAKARPVRIDVVCEDTTETLADMSRAISSLGINIDRASYGRGRARFDLMLSSVEDFERVSRQLLLDDGVFSVERG